MTRSRRSAGHLARGTAALATIVAILTIPPWVLTRFVGWPLPDKVPGVDDVTEALRGPIPDAAVVGALACACWITWALLAASLLAEIVSTITRRAATSVPFGALLQPIARQLVLSATLLVSVARPSAAASQPVPAQPPAALPLHPAGPEEARAGEAPPQPTCVLAPRDSLWRLAERHLGDGLRWREIWELNRNRPMTGGRTFHNPNLIRPGWELLLPAPERDRPAAPTTPPVIEAPAPPPPPPATAVAAPTPDPAPTAAVTLPVPAPAQSTPQATDPASVDDGEDDRSPVPIGLAGATLVAAGVIGTLGHLRRRQERHRTPGHTILTPKAQAAKAERQQRAAADADTAERLDCALRVLGGLLAGHSGAHESRIEVVQVDGSAVEILLTQAVVAESGPFEVVGGRLWRLPAQVPTHHLVERATDRGCLAPALVSIGQRDGTQVLIDLEHDPLLIEGGDEETAAVLGSLALDLATNTWADDVRLLVHGDIPAGLAALDRIEPVPDLDRLPDLLRPTNAVAHALNQLGYPSTWAGRLANSGEGWPPTILLLGPGSDQDRIADLLAQVGTTPGLAVVAATPAGAALPVRRRLHVNPDGRAMLQPLGLDLTGTGINHELLEATAELLAVAHSLEPGDSLDLDDLPGPSERPAPIEPATQSDTAIPGSPEDPDRIIVRVLGPVEIEGGANPVIRRKSRELIVLLALHPRGRTEAQIKDALWPDQLPKANTFNQTVSRARTALGTNQADALHIPHVTDGCYRISAHVVTDADLLEQTLRRARANPDDRDLLLDLMSQLADAKSPFEGTKGYEWAYEKAIPARMSAILDEARTLVEARAPIILRSYETTP